MKRRPLGTTGVSVSEIGFGCGGNAGLMVKGSAEQQKAAVSTALEHGIDYFDTAPVYGDTASERNLGAALRSLGARPLVATKVVLDFEDLDDIPRAVVRSVENSLERLQRESIELVHLHNRVAGRREAKSDIGVGAMLSVEDVLGRRGVVTGFHELRKRGLVRSFGCCAFGGEMRAVRSLIDSGPSPTCSFTIASSIKPRGAPVQAVSATTKGSERMRPHGGWEAARCGSWRAARLPVNATRWRAGRTHPSSF
jgi:aryl-alcohol dehydrogenase-like predicted oxidoreductase